MRADIKLSTMLLQRESLRPKGPATFVENGLQLTESMIILANNGQRDIIRPWIPSLIYASCY